MAHEGITYACIYLEGERKEEEKGREKGRRERRRKRKRRRGIFPCS